MPDRNFINTAPPTALTVAATINATTFTVSSTAGYPAAPFLLGVERGTANEEVCLCTALTATTYTVERGYDGTTAKEHALGAAVEHTTAAIDYAEPNDHIFNAARDDHSQYLNQTRHNDTNLHTVGGEVPAGVVGDIAASAPDDAAAAGGTGRAADAGHRHGRETTAVLQQLLIPAGTIWAYAGASAPTGWRLCDGSVVSQATYPALYTAIGATYNTGGEGTGNFRLPDFRGRSVVGAGSGAGLTTRNRGQSFGAERVTLSAGEMPVHAHAEGAHTHSISDPGHNHSYVPNQDLYAFSSGTVSAQRIPDAGSTTNGVYVSYTRVYTSTTGISLGTDPAHNTGNAGSGSSHENMPPSGVATYIVKAH